MRRNSNKPPLSSPSSGQAIKDWIWFNRYNNTKYTNIVRGLERYFNLLDDVMYNVSFDGHNITSIDSVQEGC